MVQTRQNLSPSGKQLFLAVVFLAVDVFPDIVEERQ
jgi:hypothetical protein